jgi:hypothetical protein
MTDPQTGPDEAKRRAFFAELIRLQDKGTSIVTSRSQVAKQFKDTLAVVRAVEDEGIENDWPPLGD